MKTRYRISSWLAVAGIWLAAAPALGQNLTNPCAFDQLVKLQVTARSEGQIQSWISRLPIQASQSNHPKTIPVVVHVIHNGGAENISDAQIQSQIDVLNEDFGKLSGTNGDGNGVDTGVRFKLAKISPNGDCTNGIVRVLSELSNHQPYQRAQLKELNFWDPARYFNIYIVKTIAGSVLGYASFPGGPANEDGIVMRHDAFGTIGTATFPNHLGRTATHEAGHWLGLFHTFQDGCGTNVCTEGDLVCDTPPQAAPSGGCPSQNTCSNDQPDLPDQVENYMDYSSDVCKSMFTAGQQDRMEASLQAIRTVIWSDSNLVATGCDSTYIPPAYCPPAADFVTLTPAICYIHAISFMDRSLNTATSWSWIFEGAVPPTSTLRNPTVAYLTPGNFDVSLIVSDSTFSDTLIREDYITVNLPGTGSPVPYAEDFDSGQYPPTGMSIFNPDNQITWELDTLAFVSAPYSIKINNLINTNYGTIDELILPFFDTRTALPDSALFLSFNWAYARSDPNFSDELIILISEDCGVNFDPIFTASGSALATGPTQTTPFIPDSSQWESAHINLDAYRDQSYLRIKIVNVTDGGNQLFLDDLYVGDGRNQTTPLDPNDLPISDFNTYPNPFSSFLHVSLTLDQNRLIQLSIFDQLGKNWYRSSAQIKGAGEHEWRIPTKKLPTGIYHLVVQTDQTTVSRTLVKLP